MPGVIRFRHRICKACLHAKANGIDSLRDGKIFKGDNLRVLFALFVLSYTFAATGAVCDVQGTEATALERVIARNCGQIPYPIEAIGAFLKIESNIFSFGDLGQGIDFFRIPYGRSLVRAHTNSAHPRYVTEFSYLSAGLSGGFLPLLYLGFTPNTHQIEAISWNDLQRRYEFYVVENYGSSEVRVVRPNRATCTACHQNGGPIFPRAPWSEIEGSPQLDLSASDGEVGAPQASAIPGAFAFDSRIRQSAMALKIADVCQTICQNTQCKADFMAALIAESAKKPNVNLGSLSSKSATQPYSLDQFFKDHPENHLEEYAGRPSSVIPDRATARDGVRTITLQLIPGTEAIAPDVFADDILDSVSPITPGGLGVVQVTDTHPAADPLTPRPLQKISRSQLLRNTATALKVCYGTWRDQIGELGLDLKTLTRNIRNSPWAKNYFSNPKHNTEQTLSFISGHPIAKEARSRDRVVKSLPHPLNRSPRVILTKVCGSCHGSGIDSLGSGGYELPLGSPQALAVYSEKSPGRLLQMLRGRAMPPMDSQYSISAEERERLIRFLESSLKP